MKKNGNLEIGVIHFPYVYDGKIRETVPDFLKHLGLKVPFAAKEHSALIAVSAPENSDGTDELLALCETERVCTITNGERKKVLFKPTEKMFQKLAMLLDDEQMGIIENAVRNRQHGSYIH